MIRINLYIGYVPRVEWFSKVIAIDAQYFDSVLKLGLRTCGHQVVPLEVQVHHTRLAGLPVPGGSHHSGRRYDRRRCGND